MTNSGSLAPALQSGVTPPISAAGLKYWIYQFTGWFAYSAIGLVINLLAGVPATVLVITHTILISTGIALTHGLRHLIHLSRRTNPSLIAMWPMLTAAAFVISFILAALVIGSDSLVTGSRWNWVSAIGLWWGMLLAAGVWILLYIRFSEYRLHAQREGQLSLALREAELRVLEAQINPHFLFNCLNSIRALVSLDPPRAQDMLTRLSNVLRNSLSHDHDHTVPLSSELEAVADYVALETVRFEDRLTTSILADPHAAACSIPPMILQTLVENAVKHGISRDPGRGELNIRAHIDKGFLELIVENTGRLRAQGGDAVAHGLNNVRNRLRLLYGERGSFQLKESNGRVSATVRLPIA